MPDRIYIVLLNIDVNQFLLQLLVSLLLTMSIWLTIRLIRVQWKINVLIEKLSTIEVDNMQIEFMEKQNHKDMNARNKEGGVSEEKEVLLNGHAGEENSEREPVYVLTSQQAGLLMQRIKEYMRREKPYLDPKFNMNKLCDALSINRTYLSSAINQKTGQRFETFTNAYRISDAVDLLAAEESSQYTLEYLATKVGFQSKSTFNRSFKQFTGINPSFFQRIILQDKAAKKFFFDYFEDLKNSRFSIKNNRIPKKED